MKSAKKRKTIGFVPTMGALHVGHLSLVRRARRENDFVVVSIFVNPAQFGPKEDFKKYPRTLNADLKLLKKAKVDYVFMPSVDEIYPKGFRDWVNPGPVARYLCAPKRPGHFRGVATVVKRLFEMVLPTRAYFGLKDFQQVRVIEEMTKRFHIPVQIVRCPTVREKDGLAMSSRNRYLTPSERKRAAALYRSLRLASRLIQKGNRDSKSVIRQMRALLKGTVDRIDYIQAVDPVTLVPVRRIRKPVLIALACFVGRARLIDNLLIRV